MESASESSIFLEYVSNLINAIGELEELERQRTELLLELPQDGTDLEELTNNVIGAKAEEVAGNQFVEHAKKELPVLEQDRDKKYAKWQEAIGKVEEIELERSVASGQAKKYAFIRRLQIN